MEALDDGDYLDKPVSGIEVGGVPTIDICYRGYQLMNTAVSGTSIIHQLAYLAGFSNAQIDSSVTISGTLNAFVPPSGSDSIKDLMDTLLFEYGYTLHFNEAGQISPVPWVTSASPSYTFDEENIISSLQVTDAFKIYQGAEVIYYELGEGVTTAGQSDILLYRDSELPYAQDGSFLGYDIPNGYTYPPETNVIDSITGLPTRVYQVYQDNAIQYWTNAAIVKNLDYNYKAFTSDFSSIVATSGWTLDYSAGSSVSLLKAEYHNTQAEIVFESSAATNNKLYYANVYGKVLYKTAERTSKVELEVNAPNINQYVSTFIFDKTSADTLAQKLATQYDVPQTNYTITHDASVAVGTLVNVVAGDGTSALCYVMARRFDERSRLWEYTLKTYSSASPAITAHSTTHASTDTATWMATFATQAVVADALNGLGVQLRLSTTNVSRSRDGTLTPSVVTAQGRYSDDTPYSGIFVIDVSADGISYQNGYTSSGLEASKAYTVPATVTISGTPYYTSAISFKLYEDDTLTELKAFNACSVLQDSSEAPIYLGRYDSAHPTTYLDGDWWTVYDTDDSPIQRGVWYSNGGTPLRITASGTAFLQAKFGAALTDVAWAEAQGTYGVAADYGIEALFQSLGAVTAFIDQLFANQITVGTGGRIRYETGAGVQKRTVQLANEKIDWIDTPDTSPASLEVLRARIGRLGVGSAVLMDGDFGANITVPWSSPSVINAANSDEPCYIQLDDGQLRVAYRRNSDGYLVERIWNGSSWGSESVINAVQSNYPSYIQFSDGQLRIAYTRYADNYIVERIWNGSSWGAESVIYSGQANDPSYVQLSGGQPRIVYHRYSDNYIIEKIWNGSSWGSELVVNDEDSYQPTYIELDNGQLRVAYQRGADNYICERIWNGSSWDAEEEISTEGGESPTYIQLINGQLRILYGRYSDSYLLEQIWNGATWEPATVINASASMTPSSIQMSDGTQRLTYVIYGVSIVECTLQRYAQIGAGIIESGSNADGSYIKYSDGTMECWNEGSVTDWAINNAYVSLYQGIRSFSFPQEFYSDPVANAGRAKWGTGASWVVDTYSSTTTVTIRAMDVLSRATGTAVEYSWRAIGRWKA
jgi:hypothetical protein